MGASFPLTTLNSYLLYFNQFLNVTLPSKTFAFKSYIEENFCEIHLFGRGKIISKPNQQFWSQTRKIGPRKGHLATLTRPRAMPGECLFGKVWLMVGIEKEWLQRSTWNINKSYKNA